jgi:inner membrane protein
VPSVLGHGAAALALTTALRPKDAPTRLFVAAAFCSVFPDADVVAFAFGIPYSHPLGHRGFSHSIAFAAVVALALTFLLFREGAVRRAHAFLVLFLSGVSHGLLDAMTNGGLGIAFFAPFSNHRYFFPWRPIVVSPIGIERFFGPRGVVVLASELVWVWLPSAVLAALAWVFRRRLGPGRALSSTL